MKIKTGLFLFLLLLIAGAHCFANRDENMEPAEGFFLPGGNPAAGQKAFADLKCFTCHQVEKSAEFLGPASKKGPVLGGKQADYPSGWIANSIVSPAHTLVPDSYAEVETDELPEMNDFTEKMTVRQMIDIVAYIKSLGEKIGSRNGSDES